MSQREILYVIALSESGVDEIRVTPKTIIAKIGEPENTHARAALNDMSLAQIAGAAMAVAENLKNAAAA